MCLLLEKARKDYNVVCLVQKNNDESYLDVCCYHVQQAIEKVLKCSIEMRGMRYSFVHAIAPLYEQYVQAGWEELRDLELMAGTLTEWESGSRYKESFFATAKQLEYAKEIYLVLEKRLMDFLKKDVSEISSF